MNTLRLSREDYFDKVMGCWLWIALNRIESI